MTAWLSNYGGYIQFFVLMAFYLVLAVCAIIAVVQLTKLTSAKISADQALLEMYAVEDGGECCGGHHHDEDASDVTVEKFVD